MTNLTHASSLCLPTQLTKRLLGRCRSTGLLGIGARQVDLMCQWVGKLVMVSIADSYRELTAWLTGLARPSPAAEDLALLRTLTSLR